MTRKQARERLAKLGIEPVGLDANEAAALMGVCRTTFELEVAARNLPQPMLLKCRRKIWSRLALEAAKGSDRPTPVDPVMDAIRASRAT